MWMYLRVLLGGAGCGLTHDQIVIRYMPMPGVHRVPGADGIGATVQEVDVRSNKQEVSRKRWEGRPEYDFGGAIIAQNNLTGVIATAVACELSNRGFHKQEGPVIVVAELSRFYNEFKGFPEQAVAEVDIKVHVKRPDGQIVSDGMVTSK